MVHDDATLRGLYLTICATTLDDFPRMLYAERCEELGDETRADFIRQQLATGEERDDWNIGAALILTTGFPDSRGLMGIGEAGVRRGFVSGVRCTLAEWQKWGPQLIRAAPLERVELSDRRPYASSEDMYCWCDSEEKSPRTSHIGLTLWNLLPSDGLVVKRQHFKDYKNEQAALDALSAALLTWARHAADLADVRKELAAGPHVYRVCWENQPAINADKQRVARLLNCERELAALVG